MKGYVTQERKRCVGQDTLIRSNATLVENHQREKGVWYVRVKCPKETPALRARMV
jgi:hypothetical protein